MPREGILVDRPYERLTREQVELIHQVSMQILTEPGLISFNREAVDILHGHGAAVESIAGDHQSWQVKIPEQLVLKALDTAPKTVKLGARNPDNTLIMHGDEPRVYFITGSETNIWLDVYFPTYVNKADPTREIRVPEFKPRRATVDDLCQSAHVCEHPVSYTHLTLPTILLV